MKPYPSIFHQVGDRVCTICMGGAFAEELVAPEAAAWPVPQGVDLEDASAIPVVYGTADLAVRHRAQLREGKRMV